MRSIKSKVINNLVLIILLMVILVNAFSLIFIRAYFYNNTEGMVVKQLDVSKTFYNKYYSGSSLLINIYDNMDTFWNHVDGQVQIYDEKGELIMDSIGVKENSDIAIQQVRDALNGHRGSWTGNVKYFDNKVMAITDPIESNGEIIGVIRIITSLEEVDTTIYTLGIFFLMISLGVFIIGILISIVLAKSLIKPIRDVTEMAEVMAAGDLSIKNNEYEVYEIEQLANTLNLMATEIQKREVLKNEFISSVSHELRTPLTAIKGWVITIKEDLDDKETVDMGFEILQKEADRLTTMVEELLDFSRLLNTGVKINKTNVDIDSFLQEIYYYLKPRAAREYIDFKLDYTEENNTSYFDENRIKQVLINLLDNSFRFTNRDGKVSLKFINSKEYIKFIVEDSGIGIVEEELPRVKEKFFKGKGSKSQNGIGLSISDEIIKAHNGMLEIESKRNVGTRITVILPKGKEK